MVETFTSVWQCACGTVNGACPRQPQDLDDPLACRVGSALLMVLAFGLGVAGAPALARATIEYSGKAPESLVGNSAALVQVGPDSFAFVEGCPARGRFVLIIHGRPHALGGPATGAGFFPGGGPYRLRT